jgi:hypothetical protein
MGVLAGYWKLWRAGGLRALLRWRVRYHQVALPFGPCQIPSCPEEATVVIERERPHRRVGLCTRHIPLAAATFR